MPKLASAFLLVFLLIGLTFSGVLFVHSNATSQTLYGCTSGGNGAGGGPGPSSLYTINPSTGATTLIGAMGFSGCSALAFNSTGTLYAAAGHLSTYFKVNTSTGAASSAGTLTGSCYHVTDMTFQPGTGTLIADLGTDLCTVDLSTGATTSVGTISGTTDGNALAFNSAGNLYYADDVHLVSVNPSNAASTDVGTLNQPLTCPDAMTAMKFDASGILWGTLNCGTGSTDLVTINTSTGAVTVVGSDGVNLDGIAFGAVPSIPEFPALQLLPLLFVAGVVLYLMIRRYVVYPRVSGRQLYSDSSR